VSDTTGQGTIWSSSMCVAGHNVEWGWSSLLKLVMWLDPVLGRGGRALLPYGWRIWI